MEESEDMEAEDVMEVEDAKHLDVTLDEETALKLLGLMDSTEISDTDKLMKEIIERTHLRDQNNRPWKSRIADRRKMLKKRKQEIQNKLNKLDKKPNFLKFLYKIKIKNLKAKKKKIEIRMKEQMRIYRMVAKIE